jgi:GT2 family glycosyltransferase
VIMSVSIMITTKNRLEDLRRTCYVLRRLDPPPAEILITADGCTDETVDFVKSEMPGARLIVNETGIGSVASRDRMMREAMGEFILSLDDDSYPEQLDCVAMIQNIFRDFSDLAVLHFPQRTDEYPETLFCHDFGGMRLTRSFANSGAVLRKSIYLQLAGFESRFFHMYEEGDYALQCVAAGYKIYYHPSITIRHHFSAQGRNEIRNHHRHSRNEFWSTLIRCPFPYLFGILSYRVFSQCRYAWKRGPRWVIREPVWWLQALRGLPYCLRNRNVISWEGYRNWLRLE